MMTEQRAVLAGGCFWGMQDLIRRQPGVLSTRVGYTGGEVANATYRNHGNHAEAIEILFDPAETSYRTLLEFFFQIHDPTTLNRQGNDIGTQYRSAIFPHSAEQAEEAEAAIERARPDWPQPIVTAIETLGEWWGAEEYHQEYWQGEGQANPYCLAVIPPKLRKLRKSFANRAKEGAAA